MARVQLGDVQLNVEQAGQGPALLCLHGFTGSAATWAPFVAEWSRRFRVVCVDLLGHGASDAPADPGRYAMDRSVADLLGVLDRLGLDGAAVLGYSMGGRVALALALEAPERVAALVLESASPGLRDPEERRARAQADAALADAIEREGIAAFVERWEAQPLFSSQARLDAATRAALRAQRLRNSPEGLAGSLRGLGAGVQPSFWDRLGELKRPALFIAGALDEKFCAVARAMHAAAPGSRLAVVPGAGHAVHLERPDAFGRLVLEFVLHRVQPAPGRPEPAMEG